MRGPEARVPGKPPPEEVDLFGEGLGEVKEHESFIGKVGAASSRPSIPGWLEASPTLSSLRAKRGIATGLRPEE
ncbi:MAG: hypothetical protein LBO00_06540 [Zoogloeaceae bacterium]|nr:hypothetical protein [Zoogloeaceae bacterium]